jgi:hypothetical protein
MARRFVRIDINSPQARDFRPLAVEPGLAMLDPGNGNAKLIFRWLGRMAASPQWDGESVDFYVQDDQGGRLEEVYCQPATREDIKSTLADEMQLLSARLQQVHPNAPSELTLYRLLLRTFRELTEDPLRTDLDDYFFRYRDANGNWRLVWCWGYQRIDEEAAPAVVCTDPECALLFLRRPGRKNKCPACLAALLAKPRKPSHWKRNSLVALLLLLLIGAGVYWYWDRTHLFISPRNLHLVAGQIADLKVSGPTDEPLVMASDDAAVVEVTPLNRLVGRTPGKTTVLVNRGRRKGQVEVQVTERDLLGLTLEPEKIAMSVGDKRQIRAMGKLAGDRTVELSPDVLQTDHLPLPRYAEVDRKTLEIAGMEATDAGRPQSLALHCDAQQASAAIEISPPVAELEIVVVTPSLGAVTPAPSGSTSPASTTTLAGSPTVAGTATLAGSTTLAGTATPSGSAALAGSTTVANSAALATTTTPADTATLAGTTTASGPAVPTAPIDLPLGQQVQLQAWATFRDGHREQVPGDRVTWKTNPPVDQLKGFQLHLDRVVATDAKAGEIKVWGNWYGDSRNRVTIRATDRAAVKLQAEATPNYPTVGQAGAISLAGKVPEGNAAIAPELAVYTSSDPKIVAVDEKTGAFHAIAPGNAVVTVAHPAAAEAAAVKIQVAPLVAAPREPPPSVVRVLSDQGAAVSFAVGTSFDDFRVVAEYTNGITRLVTKRATIRTSQAPDQAPLTASGGRLTGVRPGQTVLQAEFAGVYSQQGLAVTVTSQIEADEIRVVPSPVTLLPGETLALEAMGFKAGKSIGSLSGLSALSFKGDGEAIRVAGSAVSAVKLGTGTVTAQFGNLTSQPLPINVVATIADPLKVDPKNVRMQVGESRRVGGEIQVFRGDLDASSLCRVVSGRPDVVRYDPETRSLIAMQPGVSPISFAAGDKMVQTIVNVGAGGVISGEVVVEPASARLAPGQAIPLRVYVVTADGQRIDRTSSAALSSADPAKVAVIGNLACAVASGSVNLTASVAGADRTSTAAITVLDEPITEVVIEPAQIHLSVGDQTQLHIQGRAASGTYDLFPQRDLVVTTGGANPNAIRMIGTSELTGVSPGDAQVAANWRNSLHAAAAVNVTADQMTDLRIEPPNITILPGQQILYQVTGMMGGMLRPLMPEDGLRLSVDNPQVAQVTGMNVRGVAEGSTDVIARIGGREIAARLVVSATDRVALANGQTILDGGIGTAVVRGVDGGSVLVDDGFNVAGMRTGVAIGNGVALRFVPDSLRMAPDMPSVGVAVFEVLPDGKVGRDVTNDPNLVIEDPPTVAKLEHTAGGPRFKPVSAGTIRVGAKLGNLASEAPLLIEVGDVPMVASGVAGTAVATLTIEPGVLTLARDEVTPPIRVMATTGTAPPFVVPTTVESLNPAVLAPDPARPDCFRAMGYGSTQLHAAYGGREATINVTVSGARFTNVTPKLVEGANDFSVDIQVQGADGEAGVEYRVFQTGQTPSETWTPAQPVDGHPMVTLHSPTIPIGPPSTIYNVMIEARNPSGAGVQQYPLTFRLTHVLQQTNLPAPTNP